MSESIKEDTLDVVGSETVSYGYLSEGDFDIYFESHDSFLNALDALEENLGDRYDSGFGSQMVYGTIVFNNQQWIDRGEYDGSEWWERHSFPTLDLVKEMAGTDDFPKAHSADRLV